MKYLSDVATLKYDPEKCSGCRRCVEVCPHGVFEMRDKRAAVTDKDLCMECGACALNCEFGAITRQYRGRLRRGHHQQPDQRRAAVLRLQRKREQLLRVAHNCGAE